MKRILVTLPEDVVSQLDLEASNLLISRNTLITWKILGMESEIARSVRSRSDKPQKKLSALKSKS